MVPHRSFTILRRMCTFDPPVRSRRPRTETLEGVSGSDFLFLPTPPAPPHARTHAKKIRYLNANKKGGNNYFCGSAKPHTPQPKNYAPKFPASRPLMCALFPQNDDEIRKKNMRRLQCLRLDSIIVELKGKKY